MLMPLALYLALAADLQAADLATPTQMKAVGAAAFRGNFVRLTPAKAMQRGAVWRIEKVSVREGFETTFRFRISDRDGLGPGADGFAFVIQNNGPTALAGKGASGGFGLGYTPGDRRKAIANSLAVFFDTFQNLEDLSGNAISICTNGGDRKQMSWPPPRLGVNWQPPVQLKDDEPHTARIVFRPPLLSVFVDDQLAVRAPVDLARMVGVDGTAYVGFTASTGEGFENHDIFDWRFRAAAVSDQVTSSIVYARFDCLPAKSLCTPPEALVEPAGPDTYHVILPAHRPWSATIPNASGARVEVRAVRGALCTNPGAGQCANAVAAMLRQRTERGRTAFALEDPQPDDNEGYVEFEAIVRKDQ